MLLKDSDNESAADAEEHGYVLSYFCNKLINSFSSLCMNFAIFNRIICYKAAIYGLCTITLYIDAT